MLVKVIEVTVAASFDERHSHPLAWRIEIYAKTKIISKSCRDFEDI